MATPSPLSSTRRVTVVLLCAALLYYLVMKALALVQNRPQVEFSETTT